jgi:hypothetical protein
MADEPDEEGGMARSYRRAGGVRQAQLLVATATPLASGVGGVASLGSLAASVRSAAGRMAVAQYLAAAGELGAGAIAYPRLIQEQAVRLSADAGRLTDGYTWSN